MKRFSALVFALVLAALPALGSDSPEVLGEVADGVYTNKVMGAEAKFSGKWRVLSREEIAVIAGAASTLSPEEKEIMESSLPIFAAVYGDGIMNINITTDKISDIGKAVIEASSDLFVKMFQDRAAESIRNSNEGPDTEDLKVEKVTLLFLGEECPGAAVTSKYRGIPMYQKQAMLITENYIFNVTATSIIEDKTDYMLSLFLKSDSN